ncbi:superoxide dismutase [Halalkalibacter urbisdiaboli]|uniref:superoxide dismutase n=1 Tax=Halalkalibacter urbisdiaboli TaxID=1960589 RepID=UPI000B431C96|nr:superoxide dismutase [Halalkalibacter urbisdiaboli]
MNQHEETIEQWALSLKEMWSEHGATIEKQVGYERTEPFVTALIELLNEVEKPQQYRDIDLDQFASKVYTEWCTLESIFDNRQANGQQLSRVPIGGHKLPPLPYPYDALEPYISKEIMKLHHQKHHQSYVDGLNKAEKKMEQARKSGDYELIKHWEREAAFNGAGHYLHTIFWNIMSPRGGGEPSGELAAQIKRDFGSFRKMKEHFSKAAENVEGVGWALLVWSPRSHRLEILQAEKHQNLSQQDIVPLLVLDVWEHAYYLQYKNERTPYISNWWNVVNWPAVNERYMKARQLLWKPY